METFLIKNYEAILKASIKSFSNVQVELIEDSIYNAIENIIRSEAKVSFKSILEKDEKEQTNKAYAYFFRAVQNQIRNAIKYNNKFIIFEPDKHEQSIEDFDNPKFKYPLKRHKELMDFVKINVPLTKKQKDVWNLIAEGLDPEEIIYKLGISKKTLSNQRSLIIKSVREAIREHGFSYSNIL